MELNFGNQPNNNNSNAPQRQDQNNSSKVFKIVDQYVIDKDVLLGKGTYGSVYSGIDSRDQRQVAVKTISMDIFQNSSSKIIQNIKNEIRNMQLLHHPNIVKLYDVKKSSNNLYLIVEFCNSGSLDGLIKRNNGRLSEYLSLKVIKQIVEGFKCLYKNNIVHRDLKPANILLHNDEAKISDFGFSKVVDAGMEEQILQSIVGSPMYMSPQILSNENYSSKADIWSLGMIFYQMLYGKTPWMGKNPMDLLDKIERYNLNFPETPVVSSTVKKLISQMLLKTEKDRISWDEIFNEPILQDESKELAESLKSMEISYKNDHLQKSMQLNRIYFESNKVVTSAFECGKRYKVNKIILQQFQQNIQDNSNNTSQNSDQSNTTMDEENSNIKFICSTNQPILTSQALSKQYENDSDKYTEIFNQQKINNENCEKTQKISDWVLHRRNMAAFLIYLATEIYDLQIELKKLDLDTSVFHRAIFLLLKYHTMILFKLYRRLKMNDPEKYTKFDQKDYCEIFMKSQEKNLLLQFIKSDLNISKLFFEEFLKLTKGLLNKRKDELQEEEIIKLEEMEEILNNKQSNKQVFKKLWESNMQEFNKKLREYLKNKNIQTEALTRPAFYIKILVENSQIFKFKKNQRIEFSKFYEDIERMNTQSMYKKLFMPFN